ncbi:SDR family oxidoreductase [Stigmatella aurantiaca]|uniref:dTDP-4-dehydrorhamnose reductase n=1 Tax=Stigmatella aurantiaca (strain DW4/3-1) TaxID=378806 RepID=Q094Y2_STIAD|nr:SDR family oxidoreductase [Stigmatella aurantiaca]ADO71340.1 dTDP-4-dehydrorhamnose reductase [Stigmatella aurantiaca DW4/3-1]EAU67307.1 dTDP-4-dehydrorhamnose reductase [Stigmatella aurantiaca DW4/3-1]
MRFVVTGSNGLVGSRVCALLEKAGHEVVGLGRGARRTGGAHRYIPVDLTLEADVLTAIESAAPEAIIHPASMTEVDACERAPELAYAANVTAAMAVAKGARKVGAHLVHVSTDYVFDGDQGPYDEEARANPRGVYALTKHMGEQAAKSFVPGCAIARTAVVYGWPPAGRPNFGAWLVGALEKQQTVKLFEDQFVSPSLADSVAAMLVELGERKLGGLWNTCGGEVMNRVSFGRALCEVFGFDQNLLVPSRMADLKLPSPRPLHSGLKADKARAQLVAKPLALTESLQRFHAAWKAGTTPVRGA